MKSSGRLGPGAFTILMILVVLMMTMLGVLSLVSAQNDRSMTRRIEQASAAYYAAHAEYAVWLGQLDGELASLRAQAAGDEAAYASLVRENCGADVGEAVIFTAASGAYQQLYARVTVLPLAEEARYRVEEECLMPLESESQEEDAGWSLIL